MLRRIYNDTSYNQITIGDDTLDIKLDNTSRLAIDADGQVDLSGALTIHSATDALLNLKTSDDSWAYVQFLENDGSRRAFIGMDNDLDTLRINANENGANNIQIDTTTVNLSGNLMLRGEGGIFVEDSVTTRGGSIIQPAGGMYRTSSNTHTGAIKIAFPTGTGQIADMISFWVDVFDYGTNQAFSAYIAGYLYQDEGSNEWHNVSAQIFGNLEQNNYTVRFGHDTSNHCVLIGETTTSWNYMQVTVRNVQVGYVADIDDYLGNFAITFETSLPTIDETLSDNLTLAKGLKSSGSVDVSIGTSAGNDFKINTDGLVFEGDNERLGIGTASPTTTLDVEGTVSYKHTAFTTAGPTDNVDVSDTTVLEVDTSSNNVVIGGFTGGVQGQILYIVKTNTANFIQLEHNEGGGSQDIFITTGSDERVVGYGGYTLYCNGTSWFSLSNPTGGADAG